MTEIWKIMIYEIRFEQCGLFISEIILILVVLYITEKEDPLAYFLLQR